MSENTETNTPETPEEKEPQKVMCATCAQLGLANVESSATIHGKPLCNKHTAEEIKAEDYQILGQSLTKAGSHTFAVLEQYLKRYGPAILKQDMDSIMRERGYFWVGGKGYQRHTPRASDSWQEAAEARAEEMVDMRKVSFQ